MKFKKIGATIPESLLSEAMRITNVNQTETLILALEEFIRAYKRKTIFNLKGKLKINFDANSERQREPF